MTGRLPLLRVSAPVDDGVMAGIHSVTVLGSQIAFQVAFSGHSVVASEAGTRQSAPNAR
ncbi:hypothetical protein SAMN06296378_0252 [Salinibacterium xinjiangense]|uniref:Uncharacterized protein n=1 Tax=Salinibacterium xinjiangense TaxID=386302 RepID=A0A2C8YDM2_9MICO|nr:hypothetical protein SAMN06296378_0252 [Salinibacterium xinjiangense]